jgi:hypothetical protein
VGLPEQQSLLVISTDPGTEIASNRIHKNIFAQFDQSGAQFK